MRNLPKNLIQNFIKKTLITLSLFVLSFSAIAQTGYKEKGSASYYAGKFNGRKTASGEIFDSRKLTAAHRTLKFGTMVKVTNTKNNKSVVVKVNDRGPFAHNRVIDLSQEAANQIDMVQAGTAVVVLEVVGEDGKVSTPKTQKDEIVLIDPDKNIKPDKSDKPNKNNPKENIPDSAFVTGNTYNMWGKVKNPKGFGLQVGSYGDIENAKDLCKSLMKEGIEESYIQVGWSGKKTYRILIGAFQNEKEGEKYQPAVKKAGLQGFMKRHFD
jgi:rare lipoprotein A